MNITSGKIAKAQKVVIYGVEGIGKSTLASQFPEPLFIDTEDSTLNMNVNRFDKPTSWQMLLEQVEYVKKNQPCETLVIDTADWAETFAIRDICTKNGVKSIEDFGYGKGYVMVKERFGHFLNSLSDLTEIGINVVITAHAEIRKIEKPDELGQYDHYQLKLTRQTAPLLKEWADLLLFLNYETTIITDAKTNSKKATGGERVMYTTHHPAWDAKNRHNLPEKLPLDFSSLASVFENKKSAIEKTTSVQEVLPEFDDAMKETLPNFKRETSLNPEINSALLDLMQIGEVTENELQEAMARNGVLPAEMPVKDYPQETINMIVANWDGIKQSIQSNRNF